MLMPGFTCIAGGGAFNLTGAFPHILWAVKVVCLLLIKIKMSEIIALKCFPKAITNSCSVVGRLGLPLCHDMASPAKSLNKN